MLTEQAKTKLHDILRPSIGKENLKEKIDLLEKTLVLAPTCPELSNLDKSMFEELNNITFNARKIENEQYFKLVLFIVKPEEFKFKLESGKGLASIYNSLNVMSQSEMSQMCPVKTENGKTISLLPTITSNDPRHPEQIFKDNKKLLPFVKGYIYRNEKAHKDVEIPIPELTDYYINMLISCVEISWQYRKEIMDYYVNNTVNFTNYINKIISNYKEHKGFTYIPSTVTPWKDTIKNLNLTNDSTLVDILKNNNNLKTLKIIGYAGAGKTTTLNYLEYQDALLAKNNNYKNNIPVLISLISINDDIEDIKDLIMEKLDINDKETVEHLLINRKLNIYLDGVNEINIEAQKRRHVLDVIEEFVKTNNRLRIIVSDRDSDEYSTLNDIPTFILQTMNDEDIKNFIYGNSTDPDKVYKEIISATSTNESLYNEITHPFMLRRLISIVECDKEIPSNSSELTGIFINSIIERERIEKKDNNAKYINRLLMYLAANNESKGGMGIFYILKEFNKCQEDFHFEVNSDEVLNLCIKLGLLKEVGFEKYAFAEESFEEYYFLEAFEAGLGF